MVVEKLEHSQVKITFDVTAEEFEKALDAAFEVENAKVTIKGFRAGKAPRSVFEKTYGVESLYDEALNTILNEKVDEIYKDQELARTIVGRFMPALDEKIVRGNPFKVSLIVDVYPEVELPEYKGVEVKAKQLAATEEEVLAAVNALAKKDAEMVTKAEQVIAKGDYATFDFAGSVDGVAFPGGTAENYELQIGSGQFIPGFEDQMIGMKAEEVKDVNVTFPENYGEASLAGKAAVFKVTVHEVKEEKFPELTDEYVQGLKIEGASNLEELKAVKKAEIEARKAVSEKDRQFDEIVNKILDGAKVDMPQSLIDERVAQFKGQYEQQAKMYNIPFDTFLSLMGITKEQFDAEASKQASRQALFNVVASKIIEDEKLMPSKEAMEARAKEDAEKTGKTVEELMQANLARYYSDLSYQALSEFLLSNAKEV
ncbi:MAG: trigger factor [Acholeplasmatales bacterium]|nr:trigger factor [Acholeplasmatales bacterium]